MEKLKRLDKVGRRQLVKNPKLSFFSVALMYVGTIMGAGFASGREIWQFFGVFGNRAYVGVIFVGILFMIMGMMTSYIARELNTNDMGRVIVPGNNKIMVEFVGCFMALILFTVLITMSAAGGSIFHQQFGQSRVIGGVIIIVLVIVTVLGEFERVSKVFRFIMPVLFVIVIGVSLLVIFMDLGDSGYTDAIKPSPMASTWWLAAFLYISYNILALIPIVATASINAKDEKSAIFGTGLGGMLLGILALVLVLALQTDMPFSQALDMPMLGYSARISKVVNLVYTIVLMIAVYSSATSNFYGFTTKIKESPKKKYIIIVVSWIGFFFGLVGFKNVVAYMFPVEGFLGFVIIFMIIINFFKVYTDKRKRTNNMEKKEFSSDIYVDFENHNRFGYPENFVRVTAGFGGEALLIFGSEKTALYDCGMAYCHKRLVNNIETALKEFGREKIDYVLLSHSHYDHIGALPYVLEKWLDAEICASKKTKEILVREGALKTIKELGETARDQFGDEEEKQELISVANFRVDRVLKEMDQISLGIEYFVVLETKGHTDCSLTFVLEPEKIMFTSESTGVLRNKSYIHTAILKDYDETIESAEKCKAYGAKQIVAPHYGIVPKEFTDQFFELYKKAAVEEKDFILDCKNKNMTFDQITKAHEEKYWSEQRGRAQPKEAYALNAQYTIKHILEHCRR
ncbi:MAG: MBL fold metallo-hydrolase [Anaerovoracaceae bacterium]